MTFENLNFEVDATGIVAKLRAASGLTQREFAELLKSSNGKSMTQPQLARMEVSKTFPKIETLAQIAWVAGYAIEIHFLLNENKQNPPVSIIFGDPVMVDSTENSLYFASIQEELLSERERFLYILHEIRGSLRSRNIDHEVIPNYLSLAKASHDKCIAKSWTLIDIIEEFSKNSLFANNRGVFTSLFDILKDERRENCLYFANTLKLSSDIQKYQDNGSGESAIVRVISNRLDLIEQKAEDDLLKYAEKNSVVRFAVIKLIIPEHSIQEPNNYDDEKFKSYRAVLDDLRQQRQEVLDKLNQFDQLLAYRKSEIRLTKRLVDNYADRLIGQKQSAFIGIPIMEPKMNNLDEVRQQAITQLEALQKYLNEKGRTKEAEDISKEVTKLRDNTYQIAFVATFSAGKSTLINAMLGNDILPSMAKPTTGRLTFINDREGDVNAQVEVSKKGNQRMIVLSYRDPQDLQKYLNKYLRNGWIGKAEVYSEEKSLQFDSPVDLVKSAFYPVSETNDIHGNQARLTLNKGYSSFSLTDLSQVELGSFINNDAVKELKIYAPVKHLTKQIRLEGIQFVDTPGTNSARHADHKRITFDFIDKANALVYVMDFTHCFTESDALLLEEIRRQRQYNPRFCDKLFFAVNKIDQDDGNSGSLQDVIASIHNTLNSDYGFNLPEDRVIGVAALPALLYRMEKENKLKDDKQNEVFDGYVGRFLSIRRSLRSGISTDSISEAMDKVLQWSNIESLENALVKYLSHNNKTQELIKDALTRALSFAHTYEQDTQQKMSIYRLRLDELQQLTEKFSQSLECVATEKKLIAESLDSATKSLVSEIKKQYAQFINGLKSLVSAMFAGEFRESKLQGLTKQQIQNLQSSIDSVRNLGSQDKEKTDQVIESYAMTFNTAFQSVYPVFESNLKGFCQSRQSEIYSQTYKKAEALLIRINKELNEDMNVSEISYSSINIEMISRPDPISIRDLVNDEIYTITEQEEGDKRKIIRRFVGVKSSVLEQLTNQNISQSLNKCNAKTSDIVSNQSKDLAVKVFTAIDERINKIEQNLQQAMQDRKNLGENALLEIEKLDADLDLIRQMIAALIELYKFTENLQTNSIN